METEMPEYQYQLNCGQYVLHRDGKPIGPVMDAVAIVIDTENGVTGRHGDVAKVEAWAALHREKMVKIFPEMAQGFVVISGRLPLDVLNKCLASPSYGAKLWEMAKAGSLQEEPWMQ